jgi:hypothetical protein
VHLHRESKAPVPTRWRVACVDGLLHVAYMAAVAAESAGHRCATRIAKTRGSRRRGRSMRAPLVRGAPRRPTGARARDRDGA